MSEQSNFWTFILQCRERVTSLQTHTVLCNPTPVPIAVSNSREFFEKYAAYLQYLGEEGREDFRSKYNAVVERVPKDGVGALYIDLDGKLEYFKPYLQNLDLPTISWASEISKVMKQAVNTIHTEVLNLYESNTPIAPKLASRILGKVHVKYPNLPTSIQEGNLVIKHLQLVLQERLPGLPWDKIVDSMGGQGLRLPFSHKGHATKEQEISEYNEIFGSQSYCHCYQPCDEHLQPLPACAITAELLQEYSLNPQKIPVASGLCIDKLHISIKCVDHNRRPLTSSIPPTPRSMPSANVEQRYVHQIHVLDLQLMCTPSEPV
jgi:hypothetical protein